MRKLKRQLQRQRKKDLIDPGVLEAVKLASYQLSQEKLARKKRAVDKEIQIVTEAYSTDVENWMWGVFALALHRICGFGGIRIARVFYAAQDIHNNYVEQGLTDEDMWKMVEAECTLKLESERAEELHAQVDKILQVHGA